MTLTPVQQRVMLPAPLQAMSPALQLLGKNTVYYAWREHKYMWEKDFDEDTYAATLGKRIGVRDGGRGGHDESREGGNEENLDLHSDDIRRFVQQVVVL